MADEENKTGTVVLINIAVLGCMVIASSMMEGGFSMVFFMSLLQSFICGIVGVIIVLGKSTRDDIGQGFLLSSLVILALGFSLCIGFPIMMGSV